MISSRLIITLAASMAVCLGQTSAHRPPDITGGKITVQVEPTIEPWSLLQMIQVAPLIVDATVLNRLPTINTSSDPDHPVLQTHSVLAVSKVLAGKIPSSSATIVIEENGGRFGNWDVEVKGDPLVSPGERYILFLMPEIRKTIPDTTGLPRYGVLGAWAGKIKVTGGKVAFLPPAHANLHTYDGTDVNAFLDTVQQIIEHPYTNSQLPIHGLPTTNPQKP